MHSKMRRRWLISKIRSSSRKTERKKDSDACQAPLLKDCAGFPQEANIEPARSKSNRADFKSFEAPLADVKNHKFNQPIFGANNLSAEVPVDVGGSSGLAKFSLAFYRGGAGTFLPLFYREMKKIEEQRAEKENIDSALQEGRVDQVAFVDPNDPSVLYLSQPTATPGSETPQDPFTE
eukprot:gnl/TRDRNA2_/TRDRNA2_176185_c2_seq3.p2 gnl/TRDRNA2_/TRDRNA2_176185_c2~~gnl/TRDRNA2_/TRDRNA2_176185_c2_seq3.p2  ORF type:complete len:178 (+),score=33.39 gnl/TRDRNA2_/TRDRNA2_176185_c2_seq3:286-819(+)